MNSEQIQEETKIIREYQISYEDFFKFFPIKGDFQTISIQYGSIHRTNKGYSSQTLGGKPWIRIATVEVSENMFKEDIGNEEKGRFDAFS